MRLSWRLEAPSSAHSAGWVSRWGRPQQHACELCCALRACGEHHCPSQPRSCVDTLKDGSQVIHKNSAPMSAALVTRARQGSNPVLNVEFIQPWKGTGPDSGGGETLKIPHLGKTNKTNKQINPPPKKKNSSHRKPHSAWLPFLRVSQCSETVPWG